MKILYIGDIMGRPGRQVVKQWLPGLINETGADFVVAQGENLSHGKGMQVSHTEEMLAAGIDFFTGGNWTLHRPEIIPWLEDPAKPVVRPANYKTGTPGRGWKIAETPFGKVLVISLLGQIVGAFPADIDNPLHVIDSILEETKHEKLVARIVNFHGDFSSEKLVIGQYLAGRVTAVIGDHWHVPTADAQVMKGGTAHITDVGMVGSRDSCLGIRTDIIVDRWRDDQAGRNELETDGSMWLCGLLIETHGATGQAKSVQQIIKFGE
jgi:2',3'-cyclic-nucleotide 2'-phosphodiesterase